MSLPIRAWMGDGEQLSKHSLADYISFTTSPTSAIDNENPLILLLFFANSLGIDRPRRITW